MIIGVKQRALARELKISQQAYSKLEKLERITPSRLIQILAALKCSEQMLETVLKFPIDKDDWL